MEQMVTSEVKTRRDQNPAFSFWKIFPLSSNPIRKQFPNMAITKFLQYPKESFYIKKFVPTHLPDMSKAHQSDRLCRILPAGHNNPHFLFVFIIKAQCVGPERHIGKEYKRRQLMSMISVCIFERIGGPNPDTQIQFPKPKPP